MKDITMKEFKEIDNEMVNISKQFLGPIKSLSASFKKGANMKEEKSMCFRIECKNCGHGQIVRLQDLRIN